MKVKPLLKGIDYDNFLKQYLYSLGIKDVDKYLNPNKECILDWIKYKNIKEGIKRLNKAIKEKEKIAILMDSDCDGVMSSVIQYLFLESQGITPVVYFHSGKQHGLSDVVNKIIEDKIQLLWVADAASNDEQECKLLKENNCDVIITDHHLYNQNNYAIVINTNYRSNGTSYLSGAGMTDVFLMAYQEKYHVNKEDYSDLVAVSLVSDVMNLTSYENRFYLNEGLNNITNPFLRYIKDQVAKFEIITPNILSFKIVPLINSIQRNGTIEEKIFLFNAFINKEDFDLAWKIANKCYKEQKEKVKTIYEELKNKIDPNKKTIFLFGENEDANYFGLVANKILGNFNKPTFILRNLNQDYYSGSMRSNINLNYKINESNLANCQGHNQAAGVLIKKDLLDKFIEWTYSLDLETDPEIPITSYLDVNQINLFLCKICEDNQILWGTSKDHGIIEPTFYFKTTLSQSDILYCGKNKNTIKFTLNNIDFWKFMLTKEELEKWKKYDKFNLEIIYTLGVNNWNNKINCKAIIQKYEIKEYVEQDIDWDSLFC